MQVNLRAETGLSYVNITCETSYCYPVAIIEWILDERNDRRIDPRENISERDGLFKTRSTILFPLDENTNTSIYCRARNIPSSESVESYILELNTARKKN